MGEVCVESILPILNLNHGRVGEDIPDIIPLAKFLAASVPVESRMCWLMGDPLVIWLGVINHLYLRGSKKSASSRA